MGNIMCAFATKVFEEIYVLRVDRYWNLCFHGSFRTPFRPGWYKVLQKNLFRYLREKWIFISFLGWDYIIISLYHFIRRTNAMQWYGSDNIQQRYSSFHPRSHSDLEKLFSPRAHTQPPHSLCFHSGRQSFSSCSRWVSRVNRPFIRDAESVANSRKIYCQAPHSLDTLKKWVSNNFTRSL